MDDEVKEVWKPIVPFGNGRYWVSNLGDVKNIETGKLIVGDKNNFGYCRIYLHYKGKKFRCFRHRLVAMHFIPNNDRKKRFVNHINGDKTDNRAVNLEWVTQSENEKHAFRTGLKHSNNKSKPFIVEMASGHKYRFTSQAEFTRIFQMHQSMLWQWLRHHLTPAPRFYIKDIYFEE